MTINETVYRAVVVAKAPTKINDFITWADGKYITMHANNRYTSLGTKLTALDAKNTLLRTAQDGFSAKPRTVSKAARDNAKKAVKTELIGIVTGVQVLADADTENASTIITEAGFGVKKIAGRGKQQNDVVQGEISGSVYIYGAGKGPHNFRMSLDGETWTILLGSKNQRKYQDGLKPGELYYFQVSKALADGLESPWSDTMSLRVV